MLNLATILDNPGEPTAETRYRNPNELKGLGYDGLVVYATTGLSGLLGPDTVKASDVRRWVVDQYDAVEQTLSEARGAGLTTWLTYDAPSLARELVGGAMTCLKNPNVICPASGEALEMSGQCLEALVARFSDVDGIVLRLGDNDAHRLPYLLGNDIYSPHCGRCNGLGREDRLVKWVSFFYDLVVGKLGRKLIVRAWNVKPGGLHDTPELAERVVNRLPVDERLIWSFKFTQTDFWRYQRWNASSLVCGDRPVIYELQCQREFEGKGAVPNYQVGVWRDGMGEIEGATGLAEVSGKVNLAGLWAWVRGGGWGGPFVSEETWIDANVWAVPKLAMNLKVDAESLGRQWVEERLDVRDGGAKKALMQTLSNSATNALEMFYIESYARSCKDGWYPTGSLVQDDLIDAEAAWRIVQRLSDAALDQMLDEKQRVVDRIAQDRRAVQKSARRLEKPSGEALAHEMEYYEALAESMRYLLGAAVGYRRNQRKRSESGARAVMEAVNHCQSYWNHHQRYANYRGTATAFRSDNLWDFTQQLVDAPVG